MNQSHLEGFPQPSRCFLYNQSAGNYKKANVKTDYFASAYEILMVLTPKNNNAYRFFHIFALQKY